MTATLVVLARGAGFVAIMVAFLGGCVAVGEYVIKPLEQRYPIVNVIGTTTAILLILVTVALGFASAVHEEFERRTATTPPVDASAQGGDDHGEG